MPHPGSDVVDPGCASGSRCHAAEATAAGATRSSGAQLIRASWRLSSLWPSWSSVFFAAGAFFAGAAFFAADFAAGALVVAFFVGAFLATFAAAALVEAAFAVTLEAALVPLAFLLVTFLAGGLRRRLLGRGSLRRGLGGLRRRAFLLAAVDFLAVFAATALVAVVLAGALLAAFLAGPRVAPPRPRSGTPDSFSTPCTKPKERPASSAIFRILSPAAYRFAKLEASVLRCAPVIREPLASRGHRHVPPSSESSSPDDR